MEQLDERLCQEILGRLCALAGVTQYTGDLAYQTLSYWVGQEIRPICTRFVNEALGVKEICTPAEPRPWSPPELLSELPADRTVDTDVPARPDGGLPLHPWEKAPEPWDAQVWGSPHVCAACGTGYVVSLQEDTQCPNCAIQRGLNRFAWDGFKYCPSVSRFYRLPSGILPSPEGRCPLCGVIHAGNEGVALAATEEE